MKKSIYSLALTTLLMTLVTVSFAQDEKDLKIRFEEVQSKCKDQPRNERVRVTVTRFNLTTRNSPPELDKNMAAMLTNALQEINCFRVLESLSNKDDYYQELDIDKNYADQNQIAEKGNLVGAQMVITGEVTEYSVEDKSVRIMGVWNKKEFVKLGFILKFVNPETRDVLWSKSISVEGKAGGGGGVGVRLPLVGGVNFGSAAKDNPALANALENGIMEATELIVDNIKDIELPEVMDPNLSITSIYVEGTDYMGLRSLEATVSKVSGVKSVKKKFDEGKGLLIVNHDGNTEELLDQLMGTINGGFSVQGVDPDKGSINLSSK